jgi:tRNA threonylcarbamoyladenosine biosynthesis protein TsaE
LSAAEQPPATARIELADLDATRRLAERLAGLLRVGDFVGLGGVLGAGKTTAARHVIEALAGHAMEVPSPSFTLAQSYEFEDFTLWHFDLYRIETPEEVYELGFEEALADGVCLVEWPDRLGPLIPAERLDLTLLQGASADGRIACLEAHGDWRGRLAVITDD